MKPYTFALTALACGLIGMSAAQAQTDDLQARAWAASCVACHGTGGKGPWSDGIPAIAGRSQQVLLEKLLAFKQGGLPATVMHQHAKGYSDAELARIAAFFARQPR